MGKKIKFFQRIWTSIKDFEKYEEFAADKVSKAVIYICLLTLIFTLVIATTYTYKFHSILSDAKEYINHNIEEITLQERKT